jgi:Cu(I)/Ag(I) efflux system membrane fusion protein
VQNTDGRLKPEMFVRAIVRSRIAAGGRVLDSELSGKWISPMHPEIVKDEPGDCDICGMPLVRAEALGYVTAEINDEARPLVIPRSAALVTGRRAIVYVEVPTAEKPTYEGREIVLGPRAGNYYLVRNGLKAGELVVTNGNFKLDSALQISAKPSMMTPEGGGGGGHDHGGDTKPKPGGPATAKATVPAAVRQQLDEVLSAFDQVTVALGEAELEKIRTAFSEFGVATSKVDEEQLTGHAGMLWREFAMLMANDAEEARDIETLQHADELYLQLSRHVERVTESYGLGDNQPAAVIRLDVPSGFREQLTPLVQAYLPISTSLSGDNLLEAKRAVGQFRSELASIQSNELEGDTLATWNREQGNLTKIVGRLSNAEELKTARSGFALLSDEMLVVMRSFGVQGERPTYELHCPMAFDGRGATWLQDNDQPRNPYFGASMLPCADRVERLNVRNNAGSEQRKRNEHNH